jgi:hypothetical protein
MQRRRIFNSALCQFDDRFGNQLGHGVISIAQPKRLARCNERFCHRLNCFGIECLTVQKRCDRRARFTRNLVSEIVEPLAKLKAARQRQSSLLHGEEVLA